MSIAQEWFEHHLSRFQAAKVACVERNCWSPFPELPGKYPDAANAQAAGLATFQAHLGGAEPNRFILEQPGISGTLGAEVSPYTGKPLGIQYPHSDVDTLFDASQAAMGDWAQATVQERIGVLMQVVDVLYREHLFELTHAVMHTAGQSYTMAYAGSGVNALDRAIYAMGFAPHTQRAATPQPRAGVVIQPCQRQAGDGHAAVVGLVEPSDAVQQGGLTHPRFTQQGYELAAAQCQRHTAEDGGGAIAFAKGLKCENVCRR